jgi:hypothetical protein
LAYLSELEAVGHLLPLRQVVVVIEGEYWALDVTLGVETEKHGRIVGFQVDRGITEKKKGKTATVNRC